MDKFLIATGNQGKFGEIFDVLQQLPCEVVSLADLEGEVVQVEEDGQTHEENARLKARYFWEQTGWMTLGEDSGLEVDALKGELGLHTRRWGAGHDASDEEWLDYFLKRMDSVPDEERMARFICLAVLVMPDGKEHVFKGEVKGTIMREQQAPILPGLPLSSVFLSDGADCVYAALTKEKKAQVSHRGHAVGQVSDFLLSRFF